MEEQQSRRILVIDDRETIHEDMRKILARTDKQNGVQQFVVGCKFTGRLSYS